MLQSLYEILFSPPEVLSVCRSRSQRWTEHCSVMMQLETVSRLRSSIYSVMQNIIIFLSIFFFLSLFSIIHSTRFKQKVCQHISNNPDCWYDQPVVAHVLKGIMYARVDVWEGRGERGAGWYNRITWDHGKQAQHTGHTCTTGQVLGLYLVWTTGQVSYKCWYASVIAIHQLAIVTSL